MPTTMRKVHDMTSERGGIGAAIRDKLPDGEVVVATMFLDGQSDEFGVYVMREDEYGHYDLRAACPEKADALLFAAMLASLVIPEHGLVP